MHSAYFHFLLSDWSLTGVYEFPSLPLLPLSLHSPPIRKQLTMPVTQGVDSKGDEGISLVQKLVNADLGDWHILCGR